MLGGSDDVDSLGAIRTPYAYGARAAGGDHEEGPDRPAQQARAWLSCDRRRDPAGVHPLDPVSAQAKPGDGLCTITVIPGAEQREAARNP